MSTGIWADEAVRENEAVQMYLLISSTIRDIDERVSRPGDR